MSLKTRLKNLEKTTSNENKDLCIFIVGAYTADQIEPPVIGYSHNGVKYMRLENENDDALKARIKSIALKQTTRQDCGVKVALIHTLNKDDPITDF